MRYTLHAVGRYLRFHPEPWPAGAERLTQLVLIGKGIDTAALRAEFEACENGDAPHADEQGMWGALRHVRETEDESAAPEPL